MKVLREEPAPDRDAWEKAAKEAAARLGYDEAGPLKYRRGAVLGLHPDSALHSLCASWADGKGTWEASAPGAAPATRRFLEARLDDLQGRGVPGSGLSVLARAAAGGLLAWLLATAVLFLFTIPLCRDAKQEWVARQTYFEERMETSRAPIAQRVRNAPVAPAAFIPAASLAFLAAIPLCLFFAFGELAPALSRWNLAALITACIVFPMTLISPGVAMAGLAAGVLAPLAASAGYLAARAFFADGRAPAHGVRWAIGVAVVAAAAAIPAAAMRGSDVYIGIRDRVLFGTRAGEWLATFYYRHTPLSAFALRPPEANPRNTVLFAGPVPRGFPVKEFRFLEYPASSKDEFLRLARGNGFVYLVYNEDGGPWVLEAAKELHESDPMRSLECIAASRGALEKVFPEAAPEQFVVPDVFGKSGKERVDRFNAALGAAYTRADRRHSLRDAARLANSLAIFLGPVLLLGAWGVWTAAGVVALRKRDLRRAAAALAFASFALVAGSGFKVWTSEGAEHRTLRQRRAEFEALRTAAVVDVKKLTELDAAAAKAVPDLKVAAVHPDTGVRALAMDALGAAGSYEAFELLGDRVLKDPSLLVRYRAAYALGRHRSKDRRIALLSNAQNDEIYVAEAALDSMLDHRP